jgi:heat shock protein HtpX
MTDFEETNLFAQQAANRRKSRWIVAAFIVFFAWLGFGADAILYFASKREAPAGEFEPGKRSRNPLPWQPGVPVLGIILSVFAVGSIYYVRRNGAQKVLWATGARELTDPATDEERRFANVAEEMSIAAGITMPKLWIVDDADPNAFATGNNPANSHVAVTTGLLATLDRDELQAVLAHEYGHIKNLDTQLMTFLAALVGAVLLIREGMARFLWYGGGRGGGRGRGERNKDLGPLTIALLALWVISWILAPIAINLLALWVSRKREFLADAMSAQFTRNPLSLASALEKIEGAEAPTKSVKAGAAHLCIADPLGRKLSNKQGKLADAFATHPPMAIRIARLKTMGFNRDTLR